MASFHTPSKWVAEETDSEDLRLDKAADRDFRVLEDEDDGGE